MTASARSTVASDESLDPGAAAGCAGTTGDRASPRLRIARYAITATTSIATYVPRKRARDMRPV